MTTMSVTFINIFDVDPTRHRELLALLEEAIEEVIRHRPGFIAARLLVAADGTRIVNEAIWEDQEAIAATRSDPSAAEYARRAEALATPTPGVYSVRARFEA
jgi:quinol monooxygenase YgiN